ncbi:SDR family NAD(P)-dependent oxidoreductase [Zooshikella marina]|uniref:SDR family NAD(P)-dependent oxidoreductase n=1 Tax=Zooshikella ganghwensis TaxID=202772 RepID=UPI001BAF0118|nr:SDR family NAD(P)-dependent oxidoreductase [Zooshikella ganghwensis]MBU2705605.1 SDR family NAD(P)-dependent oxidoreductase [Zooshikella ganghwensis]
MNGSKALYLNCFTSPINAFIVGASRGIGLAFIKQLLQEPCINQVFAGCRSPSEARTLNDLTVNNPSHLHPIQIDLTDEHSVQKSLNHIKQQLNCQPLSLIINCAGFLHNESAGFFPEKKLAEASPALLQSSLTLHTLGVLLLAKYSEALLARQTHTVFASLSARVGSISDNRLGGWYSYRVSKAAHNMAIKNIAIEWSRRKKHNVCVALHPGSTATELSAPFQHNIAPHKLFSATQAAGYLLSVISQLTPEDTGKFLAWDGQVIPW